MTIGLTALLSHEVLDVLSSDFPEKFEEYRKYIKERAQREYTNKQRGKIFLLEVVFFNFMM